MPKVIIMPKIIRALQNCHLHCVDHALCAMRVSRHCQRIFAGSANHLQKPVGRQEFAQCKE